MGPALITCACASIACEQAHLREILEENEWRGGGGVRMERENEPSGMTFNLESFAYRFSMLKS